MEYTKDKNLIIYKGTRYTIVCNMANGIVTTNHPDGKSYIAYTCNRKGGNLGALVYLVNRFSHINSFIETIATQAPNLIQVLAFYIHVNHNYFEAHQKDFHKYIETIQKNWKQVLKNPYPVEKINDFKYFEIYMEKIDLGIELNELETKWYSFFKNVDFVKHFAGQLEMYSNFINSYKIQEVIKWYNNNKISIQPFLKNKNLLQIVSELHSNAKVLQEKTIADGLEKVYNKYKFLEMTDADGYNYRLLKTTQEFKKEADDMHNCLFRMGYYVTMAQEKCLIIVVTRPDGIKIDMEVDLADGKLKQCYYDNDVNLVKDDKQHLKGWADGLREKLLSLAQTED